MKQQVTGITMGDPVGVGPEILLLALQDKNICKDAGLVVLGDVGILKRAEKIVKTGLEIKGVDSVKQMQADPGVVNVFEVSSLDADNVDWGVPTVETGRAMVHYILKAIDLAKAGEIGAIVTCPISKASMHDAGFKYDGHTELLAEKTSAADYAMMMAGNRLRVVLVTIHTALRNVPELIDADLIYDKIAMTFHSLQERFGIENPSIGVAGLNPHAGEGGIFGDEEERIIKPAVERAVAENMNVSGPFPPDTIFLSAMEGRYDAVVCMYHDQGLIPFKMVHFSDGVNTTLGLPIVRTSVDHGTAYDIAGTGRADCTSLISAVKSAMSQSKHMARFKAQQDK